MSIRSVPVALIAAMIALVAVGGAALAIGRGGDDRETRDDLLERAAGELGIDSQTLKDAHAQAESELTAERQQEIIDQLVADEAITQEQADEAAAWLSQKPAAVDGLLNSHLLLRLVAEVGPVAIIGNLDNGRFVPGSVLGDDLTEKMADVLGINVEDLEEALSNARQGQKSDAREQAINDFIDGFVEDGEVTEAEGAEIKEWFAAIPGWMGENGLLLRLFSHGLAGNVRGPFLHEFDSDEFRGRLPELFIRPGDGRRENGNGRRFIIPEFNFATPNGPESGERFFYRGPEGEFEFGGDIPEEYKELLEGLRFEFGGPGRLEELFRDRFHFEVPAPEDEGDQDNNQETSQQGA